MPRKPHTPSYRHHRPSGQAVVTLGSRDHYLGPHGSPESRQNYDRLIAEWLAGGRGQVLDASPDLTVTELLAGYWTHAQSYYRKDGQPTTQLDRIKRALAPVRELYGPHRARDFGPKALKAVRQKMLGMGWCRRVINQRIGCVKRAWKWGVGEELVAETVYAALLTVEDLVAGRTPAPDHAEVAPAPPEAIEAVLGVISPVLADAIRTQLYTAARPGEALALRAQDLDRSRDVWLYHVQGGGKTIHHGDSHRRVILVGPRAQAILLPYLERHPAGYLFSPADSMALFRQRHREARRTKVQPSQADRSKRKPKRKPGDRYRVTSYARAIASACIKAGCAHWHPHQLRHSAGTFLRQEFDAELAMTILGHSDLRMTEVYAQRKWEAAMEAMKRVG